MTQVAAHKSSNNMDFWDPAVLNINEYLIYSTVISQLILCSGWFFYSSQGWTKEVTWKHLRVLRLFFFFQWLKAEGRENGG